MAVISRCLATVIKIVLFKMGFSMKKHPIEVVEAAAAESGTGSKKRKRAHIEDWFDDPKDSRPREERELWKIVLYAFNPWYNYFVSTVPGLNEIASGARKRAKVRKRGKMIFDTGPETYGQAQQFETMFELLDKLKDRKLPPNSSESRAAILYWASRCNSHTIDTFRRILHKDLRWGMQESSLNAIYPGWVPTFKVQLAQPFDETKLKFPCYVDPKFDGERCLAFITFDGDEATVLYFSRNGNQFFNYGCFDEELVKLFKGEGCMVADCEVINRKGFQSLMRAPKYHDPNFDTTNLRLIVFDFMPQTNFESGQFDQTQDRRYAYLKKLFARPTFKVELVDTRLAKDWQEAEQIYGHFIAKGLEGIILKQPDGKYEFKRSFVWVKMKSKESEDVLIVGMELGDANKRFAGKCGSLIIERDDLERGPIRVNVASGFTDHMHNNIIEVDNKILYTKPDGEVINLKGKIVEVTFDCLTEDGSYRFPRFKRQGDDLIRKDKSLVDRVAFELDLRSRNINAR